MAEPHLHASMRAHIHVFSMRQTGRNIMVSGRSGVRFPTGPAAAWWAMGLEVGPEVCVCVRVYLCQSESVFEIGLFSQ